MRRHLGLLIAGGILLGGLPAAADNFITSLPPTGGTGLVTVGTITTGTWNATNIALNKGGTGASTAADARTNLGLVIGTNVQAWDTDLDVLSTDFTSAKPTVAAVLAFREATNNGTNTISLAGVDNVTTNKTLTLPDATDTLVGKATTDELTNKTLNASVGKGTWTASGTWTIPAITLGGAITGGSQTITTTGAVQTGALTATSGNFSGIVKSTYSYTTNGGLVDWPFYSVAANPGYAIRDTGSTTGWVWQAGSTGGMNWGTQPESASSPTILMSVDVNGNFSLLTTASLTTGPIELGDAADTTLARSSAGNITVEGNAVYRVGGTDVSLADGGTNASLTASNGGIFYSTATAGAILAGTATAGQMLRSGASGAPTWSTATYPATATATGSILRGDGTNWTGTTATYPNTATATGSVLRGDGTNWSASTATYPDTTTTSQLLYSSSNNTVTGLATANSGILVTSVTGVPSIGTDLPTAVTIGSQYVYRVGGTDVSLLDGGTNASLTASNGSIVYSTATAMALSAVGSANQVLQSGGAGAPTWSTATYPATAVVSGTLLRADGTNWAATAATWPSVTTTSQILYSSSNNTVAGLTTGNNGTLITSATGVPSILASSSNGQLLIASGSGAPAWANILGTTNRVTVSNGPNSITLSAPQNLHTAAEVQFQKLTLANTALNTDGDELIDMSGTVGTSASAAKARGINLSVTNNPSTNANTAIGLDLAVANQSALSNTVYGAAINLTNSANPTSGTTTFYGLQATASLTALPANVENGKAYGVYSVVDLTAQSTATGVYDNYGMYIANGTSNTNGTSTKYGLYVESMSGADTNYAAYFVGGTIYTGGAVDFASNVTFPGSTTTDGFAYHNNTTGMSIYGAGSTYDVLIANRAGSDSIAVLTNSTNIYMPGAVLVNTTTRSSFAGVNPLLEVNATGVAGRVIGMHQWSADANGGYLHLGKSRGATTGTYTAPNSGDELGNLSFTGADNGASRFEEGVRLTAKAAEAWTNTAHGSRLEFYTTANTTETTTQRMTLLDSGVLSIGGTTNAAYGQVSQLLEVNAAPGNRSGMALHNWTSDGTAIVQDFNKSRSGTIGSYTTALLSGDELGNINFRGSDGTAFKNAAAVIGYADGAFSGTSTPGRLSFYTTASGTTNSLIERMRITAAGAITTQGATPTNLALAGTGIFTGGLAITDVTNALISQASTGSGTVTHYIGNQSITTSSDKRIKTAIVPTILNATEALNKLNVVDFKWANDSTQARSYNGGKVITGLIAQETIKVFPSFVNTNGVSADGALPPGHEWKVDYPAMVPVLVKAIQEQDAQIELLKAEIAALKKAKPTPKKHSSARPNRKAA